MNTILKYETSELIPLLIQYKKELGHLFPIEKLSTLSDSNIEKIKVEKLEYIKNKMSEYNKLSGDYEISYVSQYSPFIFLRVNKSELNQLMEENKIYEINYIENAQFSDVSSGETMAAIQNNAIIATRTNVVKNSGMTGSGVKIGQIELANPNTSNSTVTGKSITKRTTNCSTSISSVIHATEVAGILLDLMVNKLLNQDLLMIMLNGFNLLLPKDMEHINLKW